MASAQSSSGKAPRSPESYESLARRNNAAAVLQSYEKLSWYSFQRCESLNQTRMHFQNIVAGFTPEDEAKLVTWKEDFTPRPPRPGVDAPEPRAGKKGKGRDNPDAVDAAAGSSGKGKTKAIGSGDAGGSGSAKNKHRRSANGHGVEGRA